MADFNRRFSDNDPCWLVKVDSRILGPYSFNEIVLKLTSTEFKPFHESISPMDRWRPLQSQALFTAAVEKLKKQKSEASEFTFTKTEGNTSFTRTLDITSHTPTPMDQTSTPIHNIETSRSVELERPRETPVPPPPPKASHHERSNNHLMFWLYGVVVMIGLSAAYMLLKPQPKKEVSVSPEPAKNQFLVLVDKGLEHKKIGEWSEALKYFKKAQQLNSKDADLIFELAPLYTQVENQPMASRSLLEKVIGGQYKKENVVLAHTLIGLTYAYENQYKMANRYYDEALKTDESYFPAIVNSGFAHLATEQYSDAARLLSQATQLQQNNVIPYLYLLETYIFQGMKTKSKASFESAFTLAGQLANRYHDGKQEILFMQAYASLRLGKDLATVTRYLRNALMVDPDQTPDHTHITMLDWRGLSWSFFQPMCNELSNVMKNDDQYFVRFICAYKTNNDIQATQIAEGWAQKSPTNSMPLVAQALIKYKIGDFEKARVSLDVAAQQGATDKLFYQVAIKVCSRLKDTKCLRQYQDKVSSVAPLHAYLAKAGDGSEKQSVYAGLRESNTYIPLLRMQ
ncbi:MAG: tetratricopeptide repeat protein [Bdellovibrionales bacterium]|nr:tetratricopeptide repeat protein [Bdellovibrionales bacterium]